MLRQEIAAALAREQTSRTVSICLPIAFRPFRTGTAATMAGPCWSSWKTGIFMRSRSRVSMMKHSGALMSSKLMPPNVGSRLAMISTSLSGSVSSISISNTSMPANFLNRQPLPSITGFPASAPMLPRPSTAVPFEITATRLAREVRLNASIGACLMAMQAAATPGEYASAKSRWVVMSLVGRTAIFPGVGKRSYSKAAWVRASSDPASASASPGVLRFVSSLMGDSQKSREPLWPMLMMVAEVRATRAPPGPAMHDRSGLRPNGGACRLGGLSRLLAAFLHLAAHLLDLTLQELLLKLDDFLRVLGANELLREVEGGVDVLFGEADRLAVDLARAGLGRLHG